MEFKKDLLRAGNRTGAEGRDGRPGLISRIAVFSLTSWLVVGCGATAVRESQHAVQEPDFSIEGERIFQENCAPCHGTSGQGDGPAVAALRTPPADLTRISARNGGRFPSAEIGQYIDGRFNVPAHGTREMPIWGAVFSESIPELGVGDEIARGRIWSVVQYLRTIQDLDE